MGHDPSSFKRVAVLTGMTMLVGGAEISEVNAATLTQTIPFSVSTGPTDFDTVSNTDMLLLNGFNTLSSSGTLTDVQFSLDSNVDDEGSVGVNVSAKVTVDGGIQIGPTQTTTGTYNFSTNGVLSPPDLSFYVTSSVFAVSLTLAVSSESTDGFADWTGEGASETGLTVTYTYTPAISAIA